MGAWSFSLLILIVYLFMCVLCILLINSFRLNKVQIFFTIKVLYTHTLLFFFIEEIKGHHRFILFERWWDIFWNVLWIRPAQRYGSPHSLPPLKSDQKFKMFKTKKDIESNKKNIYFREKKLSTENCQKKSVLLTDFFGNFHV